MPVPCFLLFLVLEKYVRKYSRDWKKIILELFLDYERSRRPKTTRSGAPRRRHHVLARQGLDPREFQVWGPRASTDLALSPISTPQKPKNRTVFIISSTGPEPPPSSTPIRERSELLPGTLPGGGIVPGGFCIAMTVSGLMCK